APPLGHPRPRLIGAAAVAFAHENPLYGGAGQLGDGQAEAVTIRLAAMTGGGLMKHVKLGTLEVARIGLGAMGMSAAYTGAGWDDDMVFQLRVPAPEVSTDPVDARFLGNDIQIAHNPTSAIEQRRCPYNRDRVLRSSRFRQYQTGNQKNPQS